MRSTLLVLRSSVASRRSTSTPYLGASFQHLYKHGHRHRHRRSHRHSHNHRHSRSHIHSHNHSHTRSHTSSGCLLPPETSSATASPAGCGGGGGGVAGIGLCRHGVHQLAGASAQEQGESVFEVDSSRVKYGPGALAEVGNAATEVFRMQRVALFTDSNVMLQEFYHTVKDSLVAAGADVVVYDATLVEPTDSSLRDAIDFAVDVNPDGFVSLGGGSTMDTCKAASLYASVPPPTGDFLEYVNAPLGGGRAPVLPAGETLRPHIACPTTCGTGSEVTAICVFDLLEAKAKTGIATKAIRPAMAIVDPVVTASLPAAVTACSGFDVLSHAIESFTALPYSSRPAASQPHLRALSQGANPWADIGCLQALKLCGQYMVRAVTDPSDTEAKHQMMFAATLAGISFGNAGVHLPHGMSYSVAGLVKDFCPEGYSNPAGHPAAGHLAGLVPHGMSVIVNAPSVFRFTATSSPARHLEAAEALGADVRGARLDDAGEVLAGRLITLMQQCDMPNGLSGLGYSEQDLSGLVSGAFAQTRLLSNAPMDVTEADLEHLFRGADTYW